MKMEHDTLRFPSMIYHKGKAAKKKKKKNRNSSRNVFTVLEMADLTIKKQNCPIMYGKNIYIQESKVKTSNSIISKRNIYESSLRTKQELTMCSLPLGSSLAGETHLESSPAALSHLDSIKMKLSSGLISVLTRGINMRQKAVGHKLHHI